MFGIGKVLGIIKNIAPFLQFIPAFAPFATLFNFADQISNLVKSFKSGFSFLDLISKFAPLPEVFGQNSFGDCFGLSSSKISSWQNNFLSSSKEYQAFKLINESVTGWNHINAVRTSVFYSGNYTA